MKKKALSVILSIAMLAALSVPVSASAEEIGFTDGTAMEETVAPEKVGLSGEEADLPKEVPSSEDEGSSIEEAGVQDVEDEPSDQSEEAPGIIEEVSDSSEEASLFEDNYDDEDDDDEDDDENNYRSVEIVSWPKKTVYVYDKVKSVDDFDLTGLSIMVIADDSEEIISFSRNGERKQDSKGNYYECEISANGTDDTEKIVPGEYSVCIEYNSGRVETSLSVLPAVGVAKNVVRQASGVYTATADKAGYIKLVPEESGKFEIFAYNEEEEGDYSIWFFDDQYSTLSSDYSYDCFKGITTSYYVDLKKGKTYYLYLSWGDDDSENGTYTLFVNPESQGNSGVCGANAVWKIENGVMTISGSGALYNKYAYDETKEWTDVEKVVIEEGITSIPDYMFQGCIKLQSIQIAESVEKIGGGAFSSCENLQNILIPKNVKTIGEYVLGYTYKLGDIEVDQDNQYYSAVDGILYNKDQTDLIFVPDSKTECNISAKVVSFAGVNLETYPYHAMSCRDIFGSGNSALQSITVAPDNPVLTSEDGVLYTKDKSRLLVCPPKKKYLSVAAETKKIEWAAAHDCKELVSVTLPDGLEEICIDGFSGCTSLREITIPRNVDMGICCFSEKDVTLLKVYANSNAEAYAKAMGFRYEIIGSHIHNWGAGVVTKAATCTENGIRTYTCAADGETRTEIIPATGHKYGAYTVTKEPTIFAAGTESRECAVCHNREEQEIPKLTAQVKLVSKTLPMQVKKSVSGQKLIADKDASDRIASLTTSNGKVVAVNNKIFKITAKKAGKAVITVTMKSGAASKITVNVKKGKVATIKITGVKKKLTIKKGKKLTLKPVLSPITSTDKLTYSSTDEETATVSSKGVIKALKKGKAKIKVKAGKKTVTCVVTVK